MTVRSAATLTDMVGEVGYALRLPAVLKLWLEEQARTNRRSLNSEIVFRLEQSRLADEGKVADILTRQARHDAEA